MRYTASALTTSPRLGQVGRTSPPGSLPLTPPDLSSLDLTVFFLALEPDGDLLRGELTQLTPDPGTLVLLLVGGSFVVRRDQCL